MTEALEDKYIYMCKKYEKLAVDYEALYKLSDKLSQRLNQIASIIYYQEHLKHQDRWLKAVIEDNLWRIDDS